jgi:hypothetical protein
MINNIDINRVGHLMGQASFPTPDPVNTRQTNQADAALHVSFGDLISQAKNSAEADAAAVEEARQLLVSGQLTSLENVQSAAQNILSFGI